MGIFEIALLIIYVLGFAEYYSNPYHDWVWVYHGPVAQVLFAFTWPLWLCVAGLKAAHREIKFFLARAK